MTRQCIAVLRGGPSEEYEVSLATGRRILDSLPSERYEPLDAVITRGGEWLAGGVAYPPERILSRADLVVNALHGTYGEDGGVQSVTEAFGVPYTGSRRVASAVGFSKKLAKDAFQKAGIPTPRAVFLSSDDPVYVRAYEIFRSFPFPAIVKPARSGSSLGVSVVHSIDELIAAIEHALSFGSGVVVEERVGGTEVTCGVVEGFRGERLYALPPADVEPPVSENFFSTQAKYGGETRFRAPSSLPRAVKAEVERLAKAAHEAVGARHYSRSDFIVSPRGDIFILEINTLPGLSPFCSFPRLLESVGSSVEEFVRHLVETALCRHMQR